MKTQKISNLAMIATIVVSLICFALFFLVGYDNPEGDYNAPKLTVLLLFLMYGLTFITTILTAICFIKGLISGGASGNTGVPGTLVAIIAWGLFVVSLIIGAVFGIGETEFVAADGTVTTAGWVTVVDMFIGSIYILTLAAVAAVGFSMVKAALK